MTWYEIDPTAAPEARLGAASTPGTQSALERTVGGIRRGLLTALLAGGLLIVGGVAAVNAADPSASGAPSASDSLDAWGGGAWEEAGRAGHDCPEGDGATDDSSVDGSSA